MFSKWTVSEHEAFELFQSCGWSAIMKTAFESETVKCGQCSKTCTVLSEGYDSLLSGGRVVIAKTGAEGWEFDLNTSRYLCSKCKPRKKIHWQKIGWILFALCTAMIFAAVSVGIQQIGSWTVRMLDYPQHGNIAFFIQLPFKLAGLACASFGIFMFITILKGTDK